MIPPVRLPLDPNTRSNPSQKAYCTILDLILSARLQGRILPHRLADKINAPCFALRRSLLRLARQGIIDDWGEWFSTRTISRSEFVDAAELRKSLEAEAAFLAAGRVPAEEITWCRDRIEASRHAPPDPSNLWMLDELVHGLVADHCENIVLAKEIQRLRIEVRLFAPDGRPSFPGGVDIGKLHDEHVAILEALQAGDPDRARAAMIAHIEGTERHKIGHEVRLLF